MQPDAHITKANMPAEKPSVASAIAASATALHHQIKTRLVISIIAGMILWFATSLPLATTWILAALLSQLIDDRVWGLFRDEHRTTAPSRAEWILLIGNTVQSAAVMSALAVLLWFFWGAPGRIVAVLWLAGSLLHVVLHVHHERRTFFAAFIPHTCYFVGLPLFALISGGEPGRTGAAAILLAVVLYVGHLIIAFFEYEAASAAMRNAREKAQERQAAAEEANRAKSVFLANMSHEIRTPMNGILGMAAALENSELTPEQRGKLQIIRESGDHLMSVLNDLLDLSKIEAKRIEIENTAFCLSECVIRVANLHSLKAEEKALKLNVVTRGDMSSLRTGDPHRILQILHNLVANAIKFTERGAVTITVSSGEEPETVGDVCFEVSDTGIGVTPEQASRIFVPFTQADATTTRKYGGTGLGLAIVKSIVDAMDGEVSLTSSPGKGATFTVRLKLPLVEQRDELTQTETSSVQDTSTRHSRSLRILAAEDNLVNQSVLKALLQPQITDVRFAKDGLEAVAAFQEEEFDLILMDISMPVLDGVEAMRQIRFLERQSAATKQIPIIAISAHAMRQQIEEMLEAGFDGYVTKPVKAAALHKEISRLAPTRSNDESSSAVA